MSKPYQGYPYVNPPVTPINDSSNTEPKNLPARHLNRPYQGYPYVNPPVNDAPTIDTVTASKWSHLPKKQLYPISARYSPSGDSQSSSRKQEESDPEPVVYVDVPSQNDSPVYFTQQRNPESTESLTDKRDIDENPVVYIDLPESSGSNVTQSSVQTRHDVQHDSSESKIDLDENPVVYIDLPEPSGSNVVQSRDQTPQSDAPSFVQDTIFYDPFDNRRIDQAKDSHSETNGNTDSDDDASETSQPIPFNPVRRPNTLNIHSAGSSAYSGPSSSTPASMLKESQIYQPELPTPIPASEFPDPPPAYAEIDRVSSPVVEGERPERTVVILPGSNTENPSTPTATNEGSLPTTPGTDQFNQNRKVMTCQHCGQRVQTLVVKENGIITHAMAVLCMIICLVPAVACIYCTDYMKVTNHYCPHCNRVIGYDLPFMRNKIVYSD